VDRSVAEGLLRPERLPAVRVEDGSVLTDLPELEPPRSRRFEGLYGRIYNSIIQTPRLRRAVFSLWGSTEPLQSLEEFVECAVRDVRDAILLDVPSGGGTLLELLARTDFSRTVVEVDVAAAMMRRAVQAAQRLDGRSFEVVFVRSDALDLPLREEVADVVVSINGLHVVPDHAQFLRELARVTKPGGSLWLITPIAGPSRRSRAILAAARLFEITPVTPPTLANLRGLLEDAGFGDVRWHGGESIAGFSARKAEPGRAQRANSDA
jgi:SAM-dependent methyltransferase